jgi:hypothetical protein
MVFILAAIAAALVFGWAAIEKYRVLAMVVASRFSQVGADFQPRQNRALDLRGGREPRDGRRARPRRYLSMCSCRVRRWIRGADNDVALLRPSFMARWGLVVISTIIDNLGLVGEWFIASILVALIGPAFSSLSLP